MPIIHSAFARQPRCFLEARSLLGERADRTLFANLDVVVNAGDGLRIAGRNGSGKTTLLRGLLRLTVHVEGSICWHGAQSPLFIGHRPGISGQLTVLENLRFLAQLHQCGCELEHLLQALSAVGLGHYAEVMAQQLSAGQHRRVILALLYLPQPLRCWVLDEPFTALDQAFVYDLETHLNAHCEAGGAVMLTSHQLPQVWVHETLDLTARQES